MADPSSGERYDFAALREGRAIAVYPVVVFGLALPLLARWLAPMWEDASDIAQGRFLARVAVSFLLLACFPTMLVMIRIGLTDVSASQHRRILSLYPLLCIAW